MIHICDDKNDELKDVNLFRFEIGSLTLSIWKVPVYGNLDIYNGKHCFSISWKYFYFGVSKQ